MKSIYFWGFTLVFVNAALQINYTDFASIFTKKNTKNVINPNILWLLVGEIIFIVILGKISTINQTTAYISGGTLTLLWLIWFMNHSNIFFGDTPSGSILNFIQSKIEGK